MSEDILVVTTGVCVGGGVEVRDAVKHPTMHRTNAPAMEIHRTLNAHMWAHGTGTTRGEKGFGMEPMWGPDRLQPVLTFLLAGGWYLVVDGLRSP